MLPEVLWSPNSPDCNPIENLCAYVKEFVAKRQPKSMPALKQAIIDAWDDIPDSMLDSLWQSCPAAMPL